MSRARKINIKVPLIIQPIDESGYHIFIKVKWKNRVQLALVDTGATHSVFDISLLDAVPLSNSSNNKAVGINAEEMETFVEIVKYLKICNYKIPFFTATFINLENVNEVYRKLGLKAFSIIIGSDLLHKCNAVIDFRKAELRLKVTEGV